MKTNAELAKKIIEDVKASESYEVYDVLCTDIEYVLNKKDKIIDEAFKHLALALSFAPSGPVPKGLDPTFYHTLNYERECSLQERIDEAQRVLKEYLKERNK